MKNIKILWTDDEIDLLKPHILFLENKGYKVVTANNGEDALRLVQSEKFDLIFLDENMPGLSGIEVLSRIKSGFPQIPVVMVTKSEEEDIMDAAIGSKISDYLIKPVNPKQILLTIKKNLDNKRLITKETTSAYQSQFNQIGSLINSAAHYSDWINIYKQLVYWELEIERSGDSGLDDILKMQKMDANNNFCKYIISSYQRWFDAGNSDKPLLSPNIFKNRVFPLLEEGRKVFLLLVDNLRLDQWQIIFPVLSEYYEVVDNDLYFSILPTATQYSRNAIFAGLMPYEIKKTYPQLWLDELDEGQKNEFEEELLSKQMVRLGGGYKFHYEKIQNHKIGKKVLDNIPQLLHHDLVVIVYNFVDMLSHARTEMQMIRELAEDEAAYRSLTLSWFQHSELLDIIRKLSENDVTIIITTDHGTIRVANPVKVIGDKKTSANLRYKQGKNLNYPRKTVLEIHDPAKIHLPASNLSSSFIFALKNDFFVYPNNYNYFVNYYRNTFQHGGISMEEMMIPLITAIPK